MNRRIVLSLGIVVSAFMMLAFIPKTVYAADTGSETIGITESSIELVEKKGYLYCYKDGVLKTGWQEIDGNTYYFKKTTGKRNVIKKYIYNVIIKLMIYSLDYV